METLSFSAKLLSEVKFSLLMLVCRFGERLIARGVQSPSVLLILPCFFLLCFYIVIALVISSPEPPPRRQTDNPDVKEMLARATLLKEKLEAEVEFDRIGERIEVKNGWVEKNIVTITIPQLIGTPSLAGIASRVRFHKDGAKQLSDAFAEIDSLGLSKRIIMWCGAYAPRTVRNSTVLSAHALGIALDINCNALPPGRRFDLSNDVTFARLVTILQKHGFVWGGYFSVPDPMHFELYRLD
jgi:D-alanyl-D-alanine carboxypeptidase